jgi:hypothetical protein
MLFSLFTTPSPSIDMHDDEAVAGFVGAFVVRGFLDARSPRRSVAGW